MGIVYGLGAGRRLSGGGGEAVEVFFHLGGGELFEGAFGRRGLRAAAPGDAGKGFEFADPFFKGVELLLQGRHTPGLQMTGHVSRRPIGSARVLQQVRVAQQEQARLLVMRRLGVQEFGEIAPGSLPGPRLGLQKLPAGGLGGRRRLPRAQTPGFVAGQIGQVELSLPLEAQGGLLVIAGREGRRGRSARRFPAAGRALQGRESRGGIRRGRGRGGVGGRRQGGPGAESRRGR